MNQQIANLIALLKEAPDEQVQQELMKLLFTHQELEQLVARFEIISGLLTKTETQRELSSRLGLSIAKITRGSNELKRCSPELRAFLQKRIG